MSGRDWTDRKITPDFNRAASADKPPPETPTKVEAQGAWMDLHPESVGTTHTPGSPIIPAKGPTFGPGGPSTPDRPGAPDKPNGPDPDRGQPRADQRLTDRSAADPFNAAEARANSEQAQAERAALEAARARENEAGKDH